MKDKRELREKWEAEKAKKKREEEAERA